MLSPPVNATDSRAADPLPDDASLGPRIASMTPRNVRGRGKYVSVSSESDTEQADIAPCAIDKKDGSRRRLDQFTRDDLRFAHTRRSVITCTDAETTSTHRAAFDIISIVPSIRML